MKTKRFVLTIDEDVMEVARTGAKQRGVSIASFIRQLIIQNSVKSLYTAQTAPNKGSWLSNIVHKIKGA